MIAGRPRRSVAPIIGRSGSGWKQGADRQTPGSPLAPPPWDADATMSRATHVATFCAGAIFATATLALAVPKDVTRFRAFDAVAQALALVENNYVDTVDEQKLLADAVRGMLHTLDVHSTYPPPKRYQKVRQDTEG